MTNLTSQKVLIVDDDALDREVYKRYLLESSRRIFSFTEEATGAAAIERLKTFEADCVLLDFTLPDMTGLELLAQLRGSASSCPVPIVMLTGIRDERVAVEAMKMGAMDYLPKGHIAAETLGHAIDNAIEKFRMQRALEASEQLHRGLIEAIPHIVWTATTTGVIDYANSQWFDNVGASLESLAKSGWAMMVHPEDLERHTAAWDAGIRSETPFEIEHRLKQKRDGRFRWYLSRAIPIRNEAGVVGKWFGTSTDIEDQKRAAVAVLNKQKLESIGLLAGGIAHDFNNLLVPILGGASFALDELPPSHPLQSILRDIVLSAERASYLTRQMLSYAGKGQFSIEPVDLNEFVTSTCDLIRASLPKQVEIRFHRQPHLPLIEADSGQIQQIIMNLVLNAAEAIDAEAGGTVSITTGIEDLDTAGIAGLDLHSGTLTPGLYAVLEVRDTGSGMTEETKSKIFDPFFTTKFMGRGLGLSAVHGILETQKGGMEIQSKIGAGSTFRIFLPVSPRLTSARAVKQESPSRGQGTILVVDDEEIVRRTAKLSLEHAGYRVLLEETGESALAVLRSKTPPVSLVLLDMSMPGMPGRQVMQQIREMNLQVPVLVCSGFSESEVHAEFANLDIAGIVQKPFTARQLGARVTRVLHPDEVTPVRSHAGEMN